MHAKLLQSYPTLRPHGLCSPPGSSVHRIFQARKLEWVAMSFSRESSWPRDWTRIFSSPAQAEGSLPLAPPGKPSPSSAHSKKFAFFVVFQKILGKELYYHRSLTLSWTPSFLQDKWGEVKSLSRVRLFVTPWTVAYQAPPSMGFSRQEYWSGLPFPSPGDLPNPGIKPGSPALGADALTSEPPGKPSSKISTSHFLGEPDICFSKDRVQSAKSSRSQLKCTHLLSFIK